MRPTLSAIHQQVIAGINEPMEPVMVDTGPRKEVIIKSDDVDLNAKVNSPYLKGCQPAKNPRGWRCSIPKS